MTVKEEKGNGEYNIRYEATAELKFPKDTGFTEEMLNDVYRALNVFAETLRCFTDVEAGIMGVTFIPEPKKRSAEDIVEIIKAIDDVIGFGDEEETNNSSSQSIKGDNENE